MQGISENSFLKVVKYLKCGLCCIVQDYEKVFVPLKIDVYYFLLLYVSNQPSNKFWYEKYKMSK